MPIKQLGILITRVFAMIFLVKGLTTIIAIPSLFRGEIYLTSFYGLHMLLYFGLAILFWFKAEQIGRAFINDHDSEAVNLPPYDQCLHVVLISFGIWMMIKSIPDISSALAYVVSDGMIEGRAIKGVNLWEYAFRIILHLGIGLFLILRSSGLKRLLLNIRNAGTNK